MIGCQVPKGSTAIFYSLRDASRIIIERLKRDKGTKKEVPVEVSINEEDTREILSPSSPPESPSSPPESPSSPPLQYHLTGEKNSESGTPY